MGRRRSPAASNGDAGDLDAEHPDNVGLPSLLVVSAEDEAKLFDGANKILFDGSEKLPRAGGYLPLK